MKRKLLFGAKSLIVIIVFVFLLNIKVSTKQGINFKVYTLKIPLYLKTLDFFDRHYNYKWTVQRIIGNSKTDEEKVLKIFKWTYENIKKAPEGYPVIDDHVWHIIIRGYGVTDQFSDVFTTLCNYANIEAFYGLVFTKDRSSCIPISFIKVDKRWAVFDPYGGVYFKNRQGGLADIQEIMKGDWKESSLIGKESGVDYAGYFKNLLPVTEVGFKRANTQSPIKRLKYEIKKWLR